ncbi:MAG TPA: DNA-processing protein DprA [Acidimicrobiales bacterium]|nr:DNA-processing protein DprA [Acidimicrobiales bacterium]
MTRRVVRPGDPGYPARLVDDPEPPGRLWLIGGPVPEADRPAVAIVGTRRCTGYGRRVAESLGAALAGAGVTVVSGLASGIDAAAHAGALAAGGSPPLAVVGTGVDVVYPRSSADLWRRVTEAGVLMSESPPGTGAKPWVFPARNRIMAAMADVVVVVESHRAGGSLHTVDAAVLRGRPVMAVPGPVTSPASAGTNGLLAEGCAPVRDHRDVLTALSLAGAPPADAPRSAARAGAGRPGSGGPDSPRTGGGTAASEGLRRRRGSVERAVLSAVDATPTTLEQVVRQSGTTPMEAAAALAVLEQEGAVRGGAGWWERVDGSGVHGGLPGGR